MFLISTTQRCGSTWLTDLLEKATGSSTKYLNGTSLGFRLHEPPEEGALDLLRNLLATYPEVAGFKTHDIPSRDFDAICAAIPTIRIITLRRDFKDIVVSRYFYSRYHWPTRSGLGAMAPRLAKFLDTVSQLPDEIALRVLLRTPVVHEWARQWAAFEEPFRTAHALRLEYEAMLRGEHRTALERFAGISIPPEKTFAELQAEETATFQREGAERFHREGKIGQWRKWFTLEEGARLDEMAMQSPPVGVEQAPA